MCVRRIVEQPVRRIRNGLNHVSQFNEPTTNNTIRPVMPT